MDELIKWLMHNLSGSQSKFSKLTQNWLWLLLGLVVFIVIV
jgi:hypothetical protein